MSLRTMVMFPCWFSILTFCVSGSAMACFVLSWGSKNRTVLGFFGMMYVVTTALFVAWLALTAMRFFKILAQDADASGDEEMKTAEGDSVAVEMPNQPPLASDKPANSPAEVSL